MAKRYALDLDDTLHVGWATAPGDGYFDVNPWLRDKQGALLVRPEPAFWSWFEDSLYGERRDASVVVFDEEGRELERLDLAGALIHELELPALDAAQTKPGALWVEMQVKAAQLRDGGATTASARGEAPAITSCRLHLHESPLPLEAIEALPIKPGLRSSLQRVVMTIAGDTSWSTAESLVDRTAALEYLAADDETVLTRVEFRVAGVDVAALAAGPEGVPRSRVVLAARGSRVVLKAADKP